jgi:bifunctional non-homologous end joining protein LigD
MPKLRHAPPCGPEWRHEVKFDGWRVQLRKDGNVVDLLSRRGHDISCRVPSLMCAVAAIGADAIIIDAELVALGEDGRPDFAATGTKRSRHCLTCFDLLWHDGADLRALPLAERRAQLAEVLEGSTPTLHLVDQFEDPLALLRGADEYRLEGIVSKRLDRPYRSGSRCGWVKVKTSSWLAANRDRWRRFQRPHTAEPPVGR